MSSPAPPAPPPNNYSLWLICPPTCFPSIQCFQLHGPFPAQSRATFISKVSLCVPNRAQRSLCLPCRSSLASGPEPEHAFLPERLALQLRSFLRKSTQCKAPARLRASEPRSGVCDAQGDSGTRARGPASRSGHERIALGAQGLRACPRPLQTDARPLTLTAPWVAVKNHHSVAIADSSNTSIRGSQNYSNKCYEVPFPNRHAAE